MIHFYQDPEALTVTEYQNRISKKFYTLLLLIAPAINKL